MGLERGTVALVDYRPEWRASYEREVGRLESPFSDDLREFEHVGSTAVPGLAAKPVVDVLAVLDPGAALDPPDRRRALRARGYERRPDDGVEGRAFFAKGPRTDRTHYLSVTHAGSAVHVDQVAFRDYLRDNPGVAEAYGSLKRDLAATYPDDRAAYTEAKSRFVEDALERALSEGYGPGGRSSQG